MIEKIFSKVNKLVQFQKYIIFGEAVILCEVSFGIAQVGEVLVGQRRAGRKLLERHIGGFA